MDSNIQNDASAKEAIIKKIDQLPDTLVATVSAILDGLLLAYRQRTDSSVENQAAESGQTITTLDQLFERLDGLPEAPELVSLTKQQRKDLMTDSLKEKYNHTDLELS